MSLEKALENFISFCQLKGLSENTERAYSDFVNLFITYNGNIEIDKLDITAVENYIRYLYTKSLSRSTVATYIRHLKIFIKWLLQDKFFSAKFIYENGSYKEHEVIFY